MTPAEDALTAAWLAECWKPCKQYVPGDERIRTRPLDRVDCPVCGAEYAVSYLRVHFKRAHTAARDDRRDGAGAA